MAVLVQILVPKGTRSQYDQLDAGMEAAMRQMGGPPPGLMLHVVRPAGEGFLLSQVWRGETDMRPFYDDVMLPRLIEAGLEPREPSMSTVWGFAAPASA